MAGMSIDSCKCLRIFQEIHRPQNYRPMYIPFSKKHPFSVIYVVKYNVIFLPPSQRNCILFPIPLQPCTRQVKQVGKSFHSISIEILGLSDSRHIKDTL